MRNIFKMSRILVDAKKKNKKRKKPLSEKAENESQHDDATYHDSDSAPNKSEKGSRSGKISLNKIGGSDEEDFDMSESSEESQDEAGDKAESSK